MSRIDHTYDVICDGRVIATFHPTMNWNVVKGSLIKADDDVHGTAFFQVERIDWAWNHTPGWLSEGPCPKTPENHGRLFVRPYLTQVEIGIG